VTELLDLSAVELRRRIGAKQLSPVELVEASIRRIERLDHAVNAMVARCFERAWREAKRAEKAVAKGEPLGLLHGLPLAVKDLEETEGLRTTFGSPLFRNYVPKRDNRLVAAMRAAGAIVVAKTNTPEWGAGANTVNPVYGATGNPFDPQRSCGGSSGGSAVALAAGMVPLASGSDTGGSLRIPASFCGVVGYRPSIGLVPNDRTMIAWTPISVLGPMANRVADVRLLLAAQAGFDSTDPFSAPVDAADLARSRPVDLSRLRVAVSEDLGVCQIDKRIRETFRARVAKLAPHFGKVVKRDPDFRGGHEAFAVARAISFLAKHRERVAKHRDQVGPNIVANVEEGLRYTARDVAEAQMTQTRIYQNLQKLFEEFDLVLCPSVAVPAPRWAQRFVPEIDGVKLKSYFHWLAPTYLLSLTGHPSVSLPSGLEPTGLPFGLQALGPARRDRRLLDISEAIEAVLESDAETARPKPNLARLAKAPTLKGGWKA